MDYIYFTNLLKTSARASSIELISAHLASHNLLFILYFVFTPSLYLSVLLTFSVFIISVITHFSYKFCLFLASIKSFAYHEFLCFVLFLMPKISLILCFEFSYISSAVSFRASFNFYAKGGLACPFTWLLPCCLVLDM